MAAPRFSFKVTILTLFTVITLGMSAAVLYVNYQRSSTTAVRVAERLLVQASSRIVAATDQLIEPLFVVTNSAALLPGIDVAAGAREHPLAPVLFSVLERNPQMTAVYLGNGSGDYYRIASLNWLRARPRAAFKAPAEAAFAVQTIVTDRGRRIERWRFLDAQKRDLSQRDDRDGSYDPRERPWYKAARASARVIVTDVYPFASAPSLGLTVARSVGDKKGTVFASDLTLTSISRSLSAVRASQLSGTHNAEIAIFTADGGLLAHSDNDGYERLLDAGDTPRVPGVSEVGHGVMPSILASASSGGPAQMRVAAGDGSEWLAHVERLKPAFGANTYLAIAVPISDVLGPLARSAHETLLMSALVVLAFLPLVYLAAGAVAAPLRRVTDEVARLQNFEIAATPPVRTLIAEIQDLARALAIAKFMLAAFSKYVPKNLVRQIIGSGIEPRLGGERRPVTVFFSDVRDFTTISEQVSPERLMEFTSEYLEGLVKIVLEHHGTVDKFVGDQVMAFWNAPTANPDHASAAARAVLACRDWSNAQNERWAKEGTPILYTRFGLHLGDAVVGNVGSSDRMDYTVVGASINLGSRIEGLNKIYGTQVLISQPVVDAIGDAFVHRPVDRVLPKGAVNPLDVHELVGGAEVEPKVAERCVAWRLFYAIYLGRDWRAATTALYRFRERHGSDALTEIYGERLRRFQAEPPAADWDGVIRYTQK
jgi:adenylate cyclase